MIEPKLKCKICGKVALARDIKGYSTINGKRKQKNGNMNRRLD